MAWIGMFGAPGVLRKVLRQLEGEVMGEEEVPEDAGGNVAASADGDDEMGTEGV
jgi:hypothetical protein